MKKLIGFVMTMVMLLSMVAGVAAAALPPVEKTDRFDVTGTENGLSMISHDGQLVIHVSDMTEIIFEDGTDARERLVEGKTLAELLNTRNLVVCYSVATFSMPPQTTPEMIVILYEIAVPLQENIGGAISGIVPPIHEFEKPTTFPGVADEFDQGLNGQIVVKGEIIDAPEPFYSDGILMLPVRAMAEALGFDVVWDDVKQGIRLGVAINLSIGKDYYTVGRMAPIELGAAPVIIGGRTFVPASFFGNVVSGYKVILHNGWVLVDSAVARGDEVPDGVQVHE